MWNSLVACHQNNCTCLVTAHFITVCYVTMLIKLGATLPTFVTLPRRLLLCPLSCCCTPPTPLAPGNPPYPYPYPYPYTYPYPYPYPVPHLQAYLAHCILVIYPLFRHYQLLLIFSYFAFWYTSPIFVIHLWSQ